MIPAMWARRLTKHSMDSLNQPLSTVIPVQGGLFLSFLANDCRGALVPVNLIPVLYTQMEHM